MEMSPAGIPGAQRFKGYQPSEIIGKNFSHILSPEDQAAGLPQKALATAAKEGKFETEGWRVRKDGSRSGPMLSWMQSAALSGGLLGYAKITRDLTERKQAEDALRLSEQQFKLLVEGVTDYAIYMLDAKGYVASWNTGAQRIKGYRPDEIIGKHFSHFYTAEDRGEGRAAARPEHCRRLKDVSKKRVGGFAKTVPSFGQAL